MTEHEQPTFAGIGSTAYIIRKEDLNLDALTPKDGKAWSKIDLSGSFAIDVEPGEEFPHPVEVPIPSFRSFRTAEELEEIAKRTGFVPKEAVEDMMQFEEEQAENFCKKLWEEMQNSPFDVFITDKDGNAQHLGKVDPKNITVRMIAVHEPQFRKRRLRVKFRKKLMRYLVRYEGRDPFEHIERNIYLTSSAAPTSRFLSKMLNQKIKLAKRGKLEP